MVIVTAIEAYVGVWNSVAVVGLSSSKPATVEGADIRICVCLRFECYYGYCSHLARAVDNAPVANCCLGSEFHYAIGTLVDVSSDLAF